MSLLHLLRAVRTRLRPLGLHSDSIKWLNMWLSAENLKHEAHFSCSNGSDENRRGAERGQPPVGQPVGRRPQAAKPQTVWSGELISLSGLDRPRSVMLPALTLHHQWVGTGAWAQGYKRPGGVRSVPSHCPFYHSVWTNCQSKDGVWMCLCARSPEHGG
ncbi:unnamed protein product [Pleuronectes platessa]|uniref:Uncharacterized protein n=1 Tax=Pleuronectes platessa TaxID=8262 RepID=A0A9N7UD04_PLEPL|nr:unnamed protein product [Pleuronectes platessa]